MPLDRCPKWDEYRPIILKIGLAMSIGMSIVVINISATVIDKPIPTQDIEEIFIIENAPPTKHPKKETPVVKKEQVKILKKDLKNIIVEIITAEEKTSEIMDTIIYTEPELTNALAGTSVADSPPIIEPSIPEAPSEPMTFVEHMPSFGDCSIESNNERKICSDTALLRYLSKNIKYPIIARESGISGNVVIRFVVAKDGQVRDVEILRDIGGGCGEEAYKVISNMPTWSPGKQNGRPVNVYYTLPVKFSLEG